MKWVEFDGHVCTVANNRKYKISEELYSEGARKELLCEYTERITTLYFSDNDPDNIHEEGFDWVTKCVLGHTTTLKQAKKLCKTHFEGLIKDLQEMLNEV